MNFVYLSPHFPPNYYQFCTHLSSLGVTVLGLADESYDQLRPELRQALIEYYRVGDMHNYDQLVRALGYFTHHYGKLDRIDSQNEYWLETEARLRTDFNIPGIKENEILRVKRKSLMKQVYQQADVPVALGRVVHTLAEGKRLMKEIDYPVVAKPDIGVGAAKTYKIENPAQLEQFFAEKPPVDYIIEEFIQGTIVTFDGLTDQDGNPVFYTSHQYSQGIMETVNSKDHVYYFSLRDIPEDLEAVGRRTLKAFNVRERFFHFEFFRTGPENRIVALEVNMRPPGGLTTDMFNYANDFDIYREWANIIVHNRFMSEGCRPYHCCYVSRKYNRRYANSHEDILWALGSCLMYHEQVSGVFSAALGDYGYVIRSPDLNEIYSMIEFVQKLA